MPTLPFDGQRTHLEGTDACLECAMIMAEACQALNRFEEGRKILHDVHRIVSRSSRPGKHPHVALPPSLLNPRKDLCITLTRPTAFPASSALRLAQLSAQSNHQRMERLHVDTPEAPSEPDAIQFYEVALRDDPWLWEAWRGICDFGERAVSPNDMTPERTLKQHAGGHAQTFAPFSDANADLPLLPFPTDLLPTVHDTPTPPPLPTHASSETTAPSSRRMSPLPSTSPATKASFLPKHLAPVGTSFATPVTTGGAVGDAPPPPPPRTQGGKKAAPGRRQPAVDFKARQYGRRVSLAAYRGKRLTRKPFPLFLFRRPPAR